MNEKILYLQTVDPVEIYGINNSKLKKIKSYFPKIKIIARGSEIKILGEEKEIKDFERRLNIFLDHFEHFNCLTEKNIDDIMLETSPSTRILNQENDNVIIFGNTGQPIKPQTVNQKELINKYENNDLIFSIGPAGTGKTFLAVALAVRALRTKQVKRIILSRPAVEAEERLGFLPGDLKDKLDPYLQPLYDALNDMIPPRRLADYMRDGIIQIAPLAFMRGRTLGDAFVILDEAQNATINQLKMFLTRMGQNSKFIVTGDITQIDLPNKKNSGLIHSQTILRNIEGITTVQFDTSDILRHELVNKIVLAYDKPLKTTNI